MASTCVLSQLHLHESTDTVARRRSARVNSCGIVQPKTLFRKFDRQLGSASRGKTSVVRASSSQTTTQTLAELSVILDTSEAIQAIRFAAVPTKLGSDIVLSAVAPGSSAEKAGLRVGQKLLQLSDPVREDMWTLNERASLRFVRDAFRMRRSNTISLLVTEQPVLLPDLEAINQSMSMVSSSESDDETDAPLTRVDEASVSLIGFLEPTPGMTIREQLERKYKTAQTQMSAYQKRRMRRREYLDDQSERGSSVFLLVGALFLVPPLAILWVAYSSGYLESLARSTYL